MHQASCYRHGRADGFRAGGTNNSPELPEHPRRDLIDFWRCLIYGKKGLAKVSRHDGRSVAKSKLNVAEYNRRELLLLLNKYG